MAIIGLSKPYYAIYSATGSAVSYASGGVLGKATEANIDIETSEDNNLYADNGIAETDRQFTGGTLTLSTDDLSQEVSKAILGLKEEALDTIEGITDEDVQELIYDDTQQTPYLGVGFIVKKVRGGVTMWRAVVLTKIMFLHPLRRGPPPGGEHRVAGARALRHRHAGRQRHPHLEAGGHLHHRGPG